MSRPPLVKICGLARLADLRHALACGADFVGAVIEVASSPRSVSVAQARVLAKACPGRFVAVTNSTEAGQLRRIVEALRPRALQVYGEDALAAALPLREMTKLWLAVGVPAETDSPARAVEEALALASAAREAGVEMIVLDTCVGGRSGGTGKMADWAVAAEVVRRSALPVLLAGGISPENAAEALAEVRPAGLDASSRLESSPGCKNHIAVRELIRAAR